MALKLSVEVQAVTTDAVKRLDALRAKLKELGQGGNALGSDIDKIGKDLANFSARVRGATDQIAAGSKRASTGLAPVSKQLSDIQGQLVALASGFSVVQAFRSFISATDQVSNLNAQLRLATKNSEEFAAAQSIVTDLANTFGVRIGDAAQSFARLSQAIAGLGGGLKEAAALTEALSAATKISGVSAQEASASMVQFAQALGSGVLQGDELRSILENNRRLAKALADGLGVTVGELKKLGEAGKLTADVVAKAVISQLGQLRAEADLVPDTVERAGNRLFNAFATWVSASEQASSAQRNVIGFINTLAANIDTIVQTVQAAGTVIVGLFAGRAIQAIVTFIANIRTAILAIGTVGAGLAALSGPLGLLAGLLVSVAGYFLVFKERATDAYDAARTNADRYLESLEKQVEQQRQLNSLKDDEAKKTDKASETLLEYIRQAKILRETIAEVNAQKFVINRDEKIEDLLVQLVDVELKIRRLAAAQEAVTKQNFFDSEKAKATAYRKEVKSAEEEFIALSKQFQTQTEKEAEARRKLRELGAKAQLRPEIIEAEVAKVGRSNKRPTQDSGFRSAALAEEKAVIEAETRLQIDSIEREERALQQSFDDRKISAQQFYADQKALRQEQIDAEIRQLSLLKDIERQTLEDPQASSADRVRAQTEILRLNRDIEIQTRKRGDAELDAARNTARANQETIRSLDEVRTQLKRLSGTETIEDIRRNALRGRQELINALAGDEQAQLDVVKLVNIEAVQEQLRRLQTQADTVLTDLSIKQEDLSVQVQVGALSAEDAEKRLNAERAKSAKALDEILARMQALRDGNVSAFGPEQEQAIQRYGIRLKELQVVADETARKMKEAFEGPLTNLFTDLIKGTKTAKDAFNDFANAVIDALIRIAAQKAAKAVIESVFGGGGTQGGKSGASTSGGSDNTAQTITTIASLAKLFLAEGGIVRGPGTPTSDSVPAMLSRDEFVVRAATVKKVGAPTMYALNRGDPKIIEALRSATKYLATGGLAGHSVSERETAIRESLQSSTKTDRSGWFDSAREAVLRILGRSHSVEKDSRLVVLKESDASRQELSDSVSERMRERVSRETSADRQRTISGFLSELRYSVQSVFRAKESKDVSRVETSDNEKEARLIREQAAFVSEKTREVWQREAVKEATVAAARFFVESSSVVAERVFNAPRMFVERLIERSSKEQRFSSGGIVRGPGTTTSDSIHTRLSRDEFVVKADTVRKIGPQIMYALNEGHPRIVEALRTAAAGVQNFTTNLMTTGVPQTAFATGGLVMEGGVDRTNNVTNAPVVNFVVNTPDVGGVVKNQTQITHDLIRAMRSASARS